MAEILTKEEIEKIVKEAVKREIKEMLKGEKLFEIFEESTAARVIRIEEQVKSIKDTVILIEEHNTERHKLLQRQLEEKHKEIDRRITSIERCLARLEWFLITSLAAIIGILIKVFFL